MSEPVSARAQTDYMDTGFRPGLPGSTRVMRKFAPLPKRQSPKPWDGAALEVEYTRMRRIGNRTERSLPGSVVVARDWGKKLAGLRIVNPLSKSVSGQPFRGR